MDTKTAKEHNHALNEYERQKRVIQRMNLSPSEYERAINRLAERLGV